MSYSAVPAGSYVFETAWLALPGRSSQHRGVGRVMQVCVKVHRACELCCIEENPSREWRGFQILMPAPHCVALLLLQLGGRAGEGG